jgi:RNA polymerase sigma-32 factor
MDSLKAYLADVKRHPTLTSAEETDYLKAISHNRNKLVEGNLKLVVKTAFEINEAWHNVELLDLIQEGNIGLIDAVSRYDLSRKYAFSTFVLYRIKGAMLDFIRNNTGPIKTGTTKAQRAIFNNIGQIKAELENEGYTIEDVADKHGANISDIQLMTAQTIDIDNVDESELVHPETPESAYLKSEARLNLRKKIMAFRESQLSNEEQFVWDNRIFDQKLSLKQCAIALGQNHHEPIRRMEKEVLALAKGYFSSLDFMDVMGD